MIRSKVVMDEESRHGELYAGLWLRFLFWLEREIEFWRQRHYHKVGWR